MARNLNCNALVLLLLAVTATLLHGSAAQTRHEVGDSTGWTIPSGGAATYANWAAKQTFSVGDSLVFNFASGQHNVAKVTKSGFDGCNGGSGNTITTSPATVTLNETGEQYFICTISGHCSSGMKLAINVTKASSSLSPAPQPSAGSPSPRTSTVPAPAPEPTTAPPPTPVPEPAPAPSSSNRPVTYTVGDNIAWTVPSGGVAFYRTWASGKNFKVGDILVFSFPKNAHNVEEVTKENFDSCNSTAPLATYNDPPVRLTLNKSGEHYFICGVPSHCPGGQKLAINVTGSSTATPPSSAATPPSTAASPNSPPSPTASSSPSPTGAGAGTGAVSPPPQNSDATSLGTVGLSATLISIAAAFFY